MTNRRWINVDITVTDVATLFLPTSQRWINVECLLGIERRYIFWVKWDYQVLWAFLSAFKFVLQNMLIFFFLLLFLREVLKFRMQHFKLLCMSPLIPPLCITICTTLRNIFYISLLVDFLIYSEKCFLVQQNKNYSCICNKS